MSKMYSTANLSDKELKEQGNRLFDLHKYEDAASCYTKAIVNMTFLAHAQCRTIINHESELSRTFVRVPHSLRLCCSKIFFVLNHESRRVRDDNGSTVPLASDV